MSHLETLYWSTRNEAKEAYKKWKEEESKFPQSPQVDFYFNEYRKAWDKHFRADMAFFIEECKK